MRTLLGEAVDEARVGVVVYDETGRLLAANAAMCRVLGYELDELLALRPFEASARRPKVVRRNLHDLVRHGTLSGTTRLRRKDGSVVEGHYVSSQTTVGRLAYYVSVFEPAR